MFVSLYASEAMMYGPELGPWHCLLHSQCPSCPIYSFFAGAWFRKDTCPSASTQSFVLLPPDPSVYIVTLLSVHSDIGPRVCIVSYMGPDGVVSCSDTMPLQNNVRLFWSPLHLLYSAQNLLDFCIAGCPFSMALGHSQ